MKTKKTSWWDKLNPFAHRGAKKRPGAQQRLQRRLQIEELERRTLLSMNLAAVQHQLIGSQDAGYSETGSGWQTWNTTMAYEATERYHAAGDGADAATFAFSGLTPQQSYQFFAAYNGDSSHASNAPFTITDGTNVLGETTLNQQFSPDQATLNGVNFQSLGVYQTSTGTVNVSLSDSANGDVVANAICAVPVTPPSTPPSVIDNADPGFAETGSSWLGWTDPSLYNGDCRYAPAGTGQNTATWTFNGLDPNATYQVYATWNADSSHASDAPYTIFDGTTALGTVQMNQQVAPADATIDNWAWQSLGTYSISSGNLVVQLSDDANGSVVANAVRLVEVTPPVTTPSVIDNADAGYSETGSSWRGWSSPDCYDGDCRYAPAGTGQNTATWTFNGLDPSATYQVYATWNGDSSHASNAPYTVFDGTTALNTVQMNQQVAPSDATIGGWEWESLGTYQASSGNLVVQLSDDANGAVVANAIQLVEVTPPATPPSVIDNSDAGFAATGSSWLGWNDPSLYNGGCRYAPAGTGENSATWTFSNVPAGEYQVFATWNASSNHADNAPYTIFDGTTELGTVAANQQLAPSDSTADGQPWASLGTYTVQSGKLVVSLSDNADGYVVADAVRLAVLDYAPTVLATPTVNVAQGATDSSLNLASVFGNLNGPLSQLTFTVQSISNAALVPQTWIAGQALEFDVAPGASGTSSVTVRATDPAGLYAEATLPIVVFQSSPAAPTGLTATVASPNEIDLSWTNANSASLGATFTVQRATDAAFTQNLTTLLTTAVNAASCADMSVTPGTTYYYRVSATAASGSSPYSSAACAASPVAVALPAGWTDTDVGSPPISGSAQCTNGVYTITGNGSDIWNTSDQFNFASQSADGDQTLVARVTSLTDTSSWAKAGVMFRDSADAGSMFVDVLATPGNGVSMQWRNATGGACSLVTIGGVAAPSLANPVWLKLIKTGDDYAGYYSLNGTTWTQVGSACVAFSNGTYLGGLAVTSHSASLAATATFDNFTMTATATACAPLPAGWTDADIGGPSPAGSATYANGVYTLSGGGADIWNTADQFNFASQTVTDGETIIARVTSLGNSNGWAKAGVMFRDSAAAGSMFVDILATISNGVSMQWRTSTGGSCSLKTVGGIAAPSLANPVWLKLVRMAGVYTGYYSVNGGATWTEVTSVSVSFTNGAYLAGLAVCSHKNGTATTATFDNVSVTAALPQPWSDADIGSPSISGSAQCVNGVYTVTGNGDDIWYPSDQFNFVSQPVSGDQTLIARVTSQTNTSGWAKAGVMFRDSAAANSMFVDVVATPGNGVDIQWRDSNGICTADTDPGVAAPSASSPVWVKLVKTGSAYTGYYSPDGTTWTEVGSVSLSFTNSSYLAGLAVTSQNTSAASTATLDNVSLGPNASVTLPDTLTDADIGAPSIPGSAECVNGVYTITGNGSDIWYPSDQFNFVSQPANGDQTLVARVTSQTDTSGWAKAGVMFRDSATANSMFVDVVATPSNGVDIQWRDSSGICTADTDPGVAAPTPSSPVWVKLVKSGSVYTGYYSPDGTNWTEVGSISLNFTNSTYLAGMAVTSQNTSAASTATLDNYSLTPAATGPLPASWSDADVGPAAPSGSASYVNGTFTLSGGGGDLWNTSDQCNIASQTASGNQTLISRVTALTDTDPWSKAGVIFRDTTASGANTSPGAMYVALVATPGNGVSLQWRNATGGQCARVTVSVPAPTAASPVWLELVKIGDTYTGYWSSDGETWNLVGMTTVNFSSATFLAGLCVSSHVSGVAATASFDNVVLAQRTTDNVALNAPVTASSTDSAGDVAANAVDGNPATNWTSGSGTGTEWLQVDLGSTCAINEIALNWGAAYASTYEVQVSNDAQNWTTLYSTTLGAGGVQDLEGLSGSGRYVRLCMTAGPQANYTLNEFAIYPLTLTWAGGSGAWGPGAADWIGPNGQLQTWKDGADAVIAAPPSGDQSTTSTISIFGPVSPHTITFTGGNYVLQPAADPLGDQIVLPTAGETINVENVSSTIEINTVLSGGSAGGQVTFCGPGLIVLGAQSTYAGKTVIAGGTTASGGVVPVVQLDVPNALPATTVVQVGDPVLGHGAWDLNGCSQTVVGLFSGDSGGANNLFFDAVTNSSSTSTTLTIDNSADYDYEGTFTGKLAVAKYGPGKLIVGGQNTNTGDSVVYDGTLQVLGAFTVAPQTVSGFGDPQITGQPDPYYQLVSVTLNHGDAAWTSTGDFTGNALTWASDWQHAALQVLQGDINVPNNPNLCQQDSPPVYYGAFPGTYDASSQTYSNVTIVSGGYADHPWKATPFLIGTVQDLANWVNGNSGVTDGSNSVFKLQPGDYGISSWDQAIVVLEDEFGLSYCDYDYNDDYWVISATPAVTNTTTMLAATPSPATADSMVALTASVTANVAAPVSPDGTVEFYNGNGATELGTATLDQSGVATFWTSSLAAGTYNDIYAVYDGDSASFASSTSDPLSLQVSPVTATPVLTSSLISSVYGQPVTFTATLPHDATGSVTFSDGGTTLGSATLFNSGGQSLLLDGNNGVSTQFANPGANQDMTVSAWVKINAFTGGGNIVWSFDGYGGGFCSALGYNSGGDWYVQVGNGDWDTGVPADTTGGWHNVVLVYSHTSKLLQFYYDGNLASSATEDYFGANSSGDLTIGYDDYDNGSQWVNGEIDEVDVWKSALTANDVSNLDNGGVVLTNNYPANMVAGYHLNGDLSAFIGNYTATSFGTSQLNWASDTPDPAIAELTTSTTSILAVGTDTITAAYGGNATTYTAAISSPLSQVVSPTILDWDPLETGTPNAGGTGTWTSNSIAAYWFDPASGTDVPWCDGCTAIFAGTTGTVTLSGTVSPAAVTFAVSGYILAGSGTLTDGGTGSTGGNITVDAGCELDVSGNITIASGATLTNNGSVTIDGTLNDSHDVENESTGSITVTATGFLNVGNAVLTNLGDLENYGTLTNSYAGEFNNNGTLTNYGEATISSGFAVENSGYFYDYGQLLLNDIGWDNTCVFTNTGYLTIEGDGVFSEISGATVDNYGSITVDSTAELDIAGTLIMETTGTATDDGVLNLNTSTLEFVVGPDGCSQVALDGAATVTGNTTVNIRASGSTLTPGIDSLISGSGGLTVSGTFTFGSGLTETLTVGSYCYPLTLEYSSTALSLDVGSPTVCAPTNFTTAVVGSSVIDLTWTADSSSLSGFQIEQSSDGGNTWSQPVSVPAGYSDWDMPGPFDLQYDYEFQIEAIDVSSQPSAPVTLLVLASPTVAAASDTEVDISWPQLPSNVSATSFALQRSDDNGATWSPVVTTGATLTGNVFTLPDTGLSSGTTYDYRIVAQLSGGTSLASAPVAATTLLSAPSDLNAKYVSGNEIDLSWQGNSPTATGFQVQESSDGGTTWNTIGAVDSVNTSYIATGSFIFGESLEFQVEALDGTGNVGLASNSANVDVPLASELPDTPTGLTASVDSSTEVTLNWASDPSGGGTGDVIIERQGPGDTAWQDIDTIENNTTTYLDDTVQPDTNYSYCIVTTNGNGGSMPSNVASVETGSLQATFLSGGQVELNWSAHSSGGAGFQILESTDLSTWTAATTSPSSIPANATSAVVLDTFQDDVTYYFEVCEPGTPPSICSAPASVVIPDVPAAPTGLQVTNESSSEIDLSWDSGGGDVTGYQLQRSPDGGQTWTTVASLQATADTYADTDVTNSASYEYQLTAANSVGLSAPATVTTLPAAPANVSAYFDSAGDAVVCWQGSSPAPGGYQIQYSPDGATWNTVTAGPEAMSCVVTGSFTAGQTWQFRVAALDFSGNAGAASASVSTTFPSAVPAQPTGLTATTNSSSAVTLTWDDDSAGGATGYIIEREVAGDTLLQDIATTDINTTTYVDDTAQPNTDYVYCVVATNAAGNSAPSATASSGSVAQTDLVTPDGQQVIQPPTDPGLVAAIDQALSLPSTHVLTTGDMTNLVSLTADSNSVHSLQGLQLATNLQSLSLVPSDFSVAGHLTGTSPLSPLSALANLKNLTLQDCGLNDASIATLPTLSSLQTLDLRYNGIDTVPTAIASEPALTSLLLYGNPLNNNPVSRTNPTPVWCAALAGRLLTVDIAPQSTGNIIADINPGNPTATYQAFAAAFYNLPIEIYQYLVNTIQYQPYQGEMKGPLAVLETGAGNDWDTDALLIQLFSAADISGGLGYSTSQIIEPLATVDNWLGVQCASAANSALYQAGLQPVPLSSASPPTVVNDPSSTSVQYFQFDHTWLQGTIGGQSVVLDPTWKFRDFQAGISNIATAVPFNATAEASYLSQVTSEPADEWYEDQVRNYLAKNDPSQTIADVPYTGPIQQQVFTSLPAVVPYYYTYTADEGGYPTIPQYPVIPGSLVSGVLPPKIGIIVSGTYNTATGTTTLTPSSPASSSSWGGVNSPLVLSIGGVEKSFTITAVNSAGSSSTVMVSGNATCTNAAVVVAVSGTYNSATGTTTLTPSSPVSSFSWGSVNSILVLSIGGVEKSFVITAINPASGSSTVTVSGNAACTNAIVAASGQYEYSVQISEAMPQSGITVSGTYNSATGTTTLTPSSRVSSSAWGNVNAPLVVTINGSDQSFLITAIGSSTVTVSGDATCSNAAFATCVVSAWANLPDVSLRRLTVFTGTTTAAPAIFLDGTTNSPSMYYVVSPLLSSNALPMDVIVQVFAAGSPPATFDYVPSGGTQTQSYIDVPAGFSQSYSHVYPRAAQMYLAVGLNANQISQQMVSSIRSVVNQANIDQTDNSNWMSQSAANQDQLIGGLLQLAIVQYFNEVTTDDNEIAGLMQAVTTTYDFVASGVTTSSSQLQNQTTFLPNTQGELEFPCLPQDMYIDMASDGWASESITGDTSQDSARDHLEALTNSTMEADIWEDIANMPSLSTASSLQYANQAHIGTSTITSSTSTSQIETDLSGMVSSITYSNGKPATQDLKDQIIQTIENLVSSGQEVVVPNKETPVGRNSSGALINVTTTGYTLSSIYNGYVGIGMLVEKPNGEGGWSESGILLQGYTVVGGVANPIGLACGGMSATVPSYTPVALPGSNQQLVGEPINPANGDVSYEDTDFSIPNLGTPLEMVRCYDSINTQEAGGTSTAVQYTDRGMGPGWSYSYSDQITVNYSGSTVSSVTWFTDTGLLLNFTVNTTGLPGHNYNTPATVFGTLTGSLATGFTWTGSDGTTTLFQDFGGVAYVTEISDRYGNGVLISRNSSGRISTVCDLYESKHSTSTRILTFSYYASGHIFQIKDWTGRAWTYVYTGGLLTSVTAPSPTGSGAAVTSYTYYNDIARSNLLDTVTDPDGNAAATPYYTTFTYYADRRGFQETDPQGDTQTFSYDLFCSSTSFVNEDGQTTEYDYDGNGDIIQQVNPDCTTLGYAWSLNGLKTAETNEYGRTETYAYYPPAPPPVYGPPAPGEDNLANPSNAVNNVAETTNFDGEATYYTYNADNEVTAVYDATDGSLTLNTYNTDGSLASTTTSPDAGGLTAGQFGSLSSQYGFSGVATQYQYTTTYQYPGVGGIPGTDRGEPLSVTSPNGNVSGNPYGYDMTWYTYNEAGQVLDTYSPVATTSAASPVNTSNYAQLGYILTTSAYDLVGDLTASTDGNDKTTTYTYYPAGERKTETLPVPGPGLPAPVTTYTYDADGNLLSSNVTTDNPQETTKIVYDSLGRVVETIGPDGTYTTDEYDPGGNLIYSTDAMGRVTQSVYDSRNRCIATINPDGTVVHTQYDGGGRVVAATDANGNTTTYTYDKLGRVLTETSPSPTGSGTATTQYYYDDADDKQYVTNAADPNQNSNFYQDTAYTTETDYDKLGRKTKVIEPEPAAGQSGPTTLYTYYPDGELYVVTGPRVVTTGVTTTGFTTTYYYDESGRKTVEQDDPGGANGAASYVYTWYYYDNDGNLQYVVDDNDAAGATSANRPVKFSSPPSDTTQYVYDNLDRKTEMIQPTDVNGNSPTTKWVYDQNGNLASTTDPDGNTTTYTYYVSGRQASVTNAVRDTTTTVYDAVGNVLWVTAPLPNVAAGDGGTAVGATLSGVTTFFVYDAMDRKVAEIDAVAQAGQTQAVRTVTAAGIGQIVVAGGPITTWQYDNDGNVISTTDPNGNTTWTKYNTAGLPVEVTDAAGAYAGDPQHTTTTAYDILGQVVSVTDPLGRTTAYQYDNLGRKIAEIDPAVTITLDNGNTSSQPVSPTTYYGYDADGNLEYVTDPRGAVDAGGTGPGDPQYTTWYFYDGLDRQTCVVSALADKTFTSDLTPAAQPQDSTLTVYNARGCVVATTNELGQTTTYKYDNLGRKIAEIDPVALTTLDNSTTQAVISPTTYYGYDADGDLKYETDPRGAADAGGGGNGTTAIDTNYTTWYFYDALGRLICTIEPMAGLTASTSPGGGMAPRPPSSLTNDYATQTSYDAAGNVMSETDPDDNVTSYVYDNLGRKIKEIDPSAISVVLGMPNIGSPTSYYSYDADGNMVQSIDADGQTTQYLYDALNHQTEEDWLDAHGNVFHTIKTFYDADGEVLGVTESDTATSMHIASPSACTNYEYTYDADGHRLTSRMAPGDLAQPTVTPQSHSLPSGQTVDWNNTGTQKPCYGFSSNGTDLTAGQTVLVQVNSGNFATAIVALPPGDKPSSELPSNALVASASDGNVSWLLFTVPAGEAGQWTFEVTSPSPSAKGSFTIQWTVDPNPLVRSALTALTYTYNADGSEHSVSDGSSVSTLSSNTATTTYAYYSVGNTKSITQSPQSGNETPKGAQFTYYANSQVKTVTLTCGPSQADVAVGAYGYNADDELTGLSYTHTGSFFDPKLATYSLQYDAAGDITQQVSVDGTSNYMLDDDSQLKLASGATSGSYSYDDNGNRTGSGYQTGTDNRLLSAEVSGVVYDYAYDPNGNCIAQWVPANATVLEKAPNTDDTSTIIIYTWDYENRLTSATTFGNYLDYEYAQENPGNVTEYASQIVTYTYDYLGNMIREGVWKSGAGFTCSYTVYDGQNPYLQVSDSDTLTDGGSYATVSQRYLYGPEINQVLATDDCNGNVLFGLADFAGTIRDVVDSNGDVTNHLTFDSYGTPLSAMPADFLVVGQNGMRYDPATGFYLTETVPYNPAIGRRMSPDPTGLAAGPNPYSWAGDSPVDNADPSGECTSPAQSISVGPAVGSGDNFGLPTNQFVSRTIGSFGAIPGGIDLNSLGIDSLSLPGPSDAATFTGWAKAASAILGSGDAQPAATDDETAIRQALKEASSGNAAIDTSIIDYDSDDTSPVGIDSLLYMPPTQQIQRPVWSDFPNRQTFHNAVLYYVASIPQLDTLGRIELIDDLDRAPGNNWSDTEIAQIRAEQKAQQNQESQRLQQLEAGYEAQCTIAALYGPGGYDGGWLNPLNLRRELYTGDPNASNYTYQTCLNGLGDQLKNKGIGISVNANAGLSTPVGGFSLFTPSFGLVYHLGSGQVCGFMQLNAPTFEASTASFKMPVTGSVNVTGLLIDNLDSADGIAGPSYGMSGTFCLKNGWGVNASYARSPNGTTYYGLGPSWGLPGGNINVPTSSYTFTSRTLTIYR